MKFALITALSISSILAQTEIKRGDGVTVKTCKTKSDCATGQCCGTAAEDKNFNIPATDVCAKDSDTKIKWLDEK